MTSDLTSYFREKRIQVAIRISSAMRFKPHSSYMRVISEAFSHIRSLGYAIIDVYLRIPVVTFIAAPDEKSLVVLRTLYLLFS
jgi:hypothetical protein